MTVADQPDASRAGNKAKAAVPPRVNAFLPPEPRVQLPSQSRGHRWLDLFRQPPEVGSTAEVRGRPDGRKAGADVADWLIMSTLDQKAPPLPNGAEVGGDLLDAIVKDHLQRAATPIPAAEAPATTDVAPAAEAGQGENADDMLQREIDALLTGAKGNEPLEQMKQNATQPETTAAAEGGGLSQAELDVLVPGGAQGQAAPQTPAVDEETKAKLDEAEGVLAEELAQLMAETQAAETPAPAANVAPAAAPAPLEETPSPPAPGPDVQPAAAQVEAAAPVSPPATSPSDAGAAAPVAADTAASPSPPLGVPPHPVVILAPDEEEEEEVAPAKGVGRIGRLVNGLGLMIAQVFDLPFSWLDLTGKNLLGFAAFLFMVSGGALMAVAWWMTKH